jgi:hypothetical protein
MLFKSLVKLTSGQTNLRRYKTPTLRAPENPAAVLKSAWSSSIIISLNNHHIPQSYTTNAIATTACAQLGPFSSAARVPKPRCISNLKNNIAVNSVSSINISFLQPMNLYAYNFMYTSKSTIKHKTPLSGSFVLFQSTYAFLSALISVAIFVGTTA